MIAVLLLAGLGLVLLGSRTRPGRRSLVPGPGPAATEGRLGTSVRLELIGTMLEAGLSVAGAVLVLGRWESGLRRPGAAPDPLETVGQRLGLGLEWDLCWSEALASAPKPRRKDLEDLESALGFAVRTGAPGADLLRAQAARLRRAAHRDAEKAAAALGVRLVVPLGLCSLPAFICLGVLPVLIGLVPALW